MRLLQDANKVSVVFITGNVYAQCYGTVKGRLRSCEIWRLSGLVASLSTDHFACGGLGGMAVRGPDIRDFGGQRDSLTEVAVGRENERGLTPIFGRRTTVI